MAEQVQDLKDLYKASVKAFDKLHSSFNENGIVKDRDHFEQVKEQTTPDFACYYTLHEAITAVDEVIAKKPSRELSLVKTKLQEALFWLNAAE